MEYWKLCSSCKKPIQFKSKYYKCSVSTCSGQRTGYVFCSLHCFERHLPGARHRDAGALDFMSPSIEIHLASLATEESENKSSTVTAPVRRIIPSASPTTTTHTSTQTEDEILIVVSKLKNYIKDKSDMNTSGDVADILSNFVRLHCDEAIENARKDGRKTVMARDFSKKSSF